VGFTDATTASMAASLCFLQPELCIVPAVVVIESTHPDLGHAPPVGPHWDYKDANGDWWRVFPNGKMIKKR
jgi:hypothetical protein